MSTCETSNGTANRRTSEPERIYLSHYAAMPLQSKQGSTAFNVMQGLRCARSFSGDDLGTLIASPGVRLAARRAAAGLLRWQTGIPREFLSSDSAMQRETLQQAVL